MSTKDYSQFSARAYLEEYYAEICDDYEDIFLSAFYHDAYRFLPDNLNVVEVGGGPVISQLISASRKAESITLSDYKKENLAEVKKWVNKEPDAFNWDGYFRLVLGIEGTAITKENVAAAKERLRSKIKKFIQCNIFESNMFAPNKIGPFDVVSTSFCPESITDNEKDYTKAIKNLISQLKPNGKLIMMLIRNAKCYTISDKKFSCFSIDEKGMERLLTKYGMSKIEFRSIPVDYGEGFEYDGLMGVTAIKI